MNRNVIRQISQQQVKCKERACQEKIIHRVQIVSAQRGQDEHQEEKEKQRHRGEIADSSRQRSGLQLLRHLQGDVESRHQVLIIPLQLPPVCRLPFFTRRKRIVREIKTGEISFYQQVEVASLRDFLPAPVRIFSRKGVAPTVQPLRTIRCVQDRLCSGRQARPRHRLRAAERHSQRLVVQNQLHVVIHRLLRRKRQLNHKLFFSQHRILKRICPLEFHLVRTEPQ